MSVKLTILIAALAVLSFPTVSAADDEWLASLKQTRVNSQRPNAIVIAERDFGTSVAISLYQEIVSDGARGRRPVWVARREMRGSDARPVRWASTEGCPQLYGLVIELERLSMPRIELRSPAIGAPVGYVPAPPQTGSLHSAHLLWAQGWTSDDQPVETTLSGLGSGPAVDWFGRAETGLANCWSDQPRSP